MELPIKIEKRDNNWFIEISSTISDFLPKEELPLKINFLNTYTKIIEWSIDLQPLHWCEYTLRNHDIEIITQNNRLIKMNNTIELLLPADCFGIVDRGLMRSNALAVEHLGFLRQKSVRTIINLDTED